MNSEQTSSDPPPDHRRTIVLVTAILLLMGSGGSWIFGSGSTAAFAAATQLRVGLVLAALWLAWPSLEKPAQWVPPGVVMMCLMGLVLLAVQPNLRVLIIPAIVGLIAFGVIVKFIRGTS